MGQTHAALRATRLGYLRTSHLGPGLQVLGPPQEPPLDLQIHRGRATLESARHLHILPLGRRHVPRKLGKFCCKTETHPFGIPTPPLSASRSLRALYIFPGLKKKKGQQNPCVTSRALPGSPTPFPLPHSCLLLVSCLNNFVVDEVQVMERLTSLPNNSPLLAKLPIVRSIYLLSDCSITQNLQRDSMSYIFDKSVKLIYEESLLL